MTPLHLKVRIRSALIRRLGGVPYDEHASVDHQRQLAESDLYDAIHELDHLKETGQDKEYALQATIDRYETWATKNNVELPPDIDAIWSTLFYYGKHAWSGKFHLTEAQRQYQSEAMETVARWTGVDVHVLHRALGEQVTEYMHDCGEGPASDFYVPDFEALKAHGFDAVPDLIAGAHPQPAREMGL